MKNKMGWVLGWAVPEAWFAPLAQAAFPKTQHVFVTAGPTALEQLESEGPYDWVAGYSLGSLLLLCEAERAHRLGRVALLAPIFAFPRESHCGGRVALVQLVKLKRWLRAAPREALMGFYKRAGLDVSVMQLTDRELTGLLWGLERLENDSVDTALPVGWCAWCGTEDPLLDAERLCEVSPDLVRVTGAGHHPAALLRAFAEAVA